MGDLAAGERAELGRVILAHEAPFSLGELNVYPDTLQVEREARSETLEPRVMQVLVALARANGKIVTRDELIERCWDGRVVGDDAINRALSRVRHIAAEFAGDGFAVQTIPRVGYRLTTPHSSALEDQLHLARNRSVRPSQAWSRRAIIGGVAGTAALATGAYLWRPIDAHEPPPSAMKLYLHGIENRGQASLQQSEQSVSYLREATRIDPDFAEAWGALAWGYRGLLAYGPHPDSARLEASCRSAARRALELDPNNSDAQAALLLLAPFYGRWLEVETGCRRLLARHPGNSIVQFNLGMILCDAGRWRDAIPSLAAVAKREQFWPLASFQLFQGLAAAGRFEEAEDLVEQATRRWPRRIDFWLGKHRMLVTSGRTVEARAFGADLAKRPVGTDRVVELELLLAEALGGSNEERTSAVSQLVAEAEKGLPYFVFAAVGAALLGELDTAFEMIDGFLLGRGRWASARPDRPGTSFLFSVSAKPLRRDPRFAALTREMGLDRYWALGRKNPDFPRHG